MRVKPTDGHWWAYPSRDLPSTRSNDHFNEDIAVQPNDSAQPPGPPANETDRDESLLERLWSEPVEVDEPIDFDPDEHEPPMSPEEVSELLEEADE